MDEAVGLAIAIPVIALTLWATALAGSLANGQARVAVASELAAQAASQATGSQAADTAERIASGATLDSCSTASSSTAVESTMVSSSRWATVTLICEVSGPSGAIRVCVVGYAQTRPVLSAHHPVSCP